MLDKYVVHESMEMNGGTVGRRNISVDSGASLVSENIVGVRINNMGERLILAGRSLHMNIGINTGGIFISRFKIDA